MKNIDDICFVIYARLDSHRAPNKMLRPFGDSTLIDVALSKIKRCEEIPLSNFYLCVHEPELIYRGNAHGVKVFKRSYESAHEDSKLPVLMEWWDKLPYTYCIIHSACVPFLRHQTIDKFVRAFRESDSEGMFSVVQRNTYYWNKEKQLVTPWPEGEDLMNSKAVEATYEGIGALFAGRLDTIGDGKWMGSFQKPNDPELFVIEDGKEALDIDDEWEFDLCDAYFKNTEV